MSRSPLLPILLIVLVELLALTMIVPLLLFLAQAFGASALEVGLLLSSFVICHLAFRPGLGMHSDRVVPRSVLVYSPVVKYPNLLLMAFADRLWVLCVTWVIDGLTTGNIPGTQAAISGLTEPKGRSKAFAINGLAICIGPILGPAASGLLAAFDWLYPVDSAAERAADRPRSADLVGAGAGQRPGPDYRGNNLHGR